MLIKQRTYVLIRCDKFLNFAKPNSLAASTSQITHPPLPPLPLHLRKPSARKIQHHNRYRPHEVKRREAPCVAFGRRGIAHGMIHEQPRAYFAQTNLRHNQREHVNQRNVQQVIKKRHAPEDRYPTRHCAARVFQQRNERNARPERHQQKEQRSRILARV